ncbi:OmpA family protein [Hymenobacter sp. BT584]|nr:OmpA family protein [Hymenobacter negativus]
MQARSGFRRIERGLSATLLRQRGRAVRWRTARYFTPFFSVKSLSPALLGLCLLAALVLNSCVTARKYDDLSARQKADAEGKAAAERQYRGATAELQKASDELAQLRLTQKRLVTDSAETGAAYRKTRTLYNELNSSYDKLLKNSDRELANKSSDYNKVAKDLARREAELGDLETTLQKSKANNDRLAADLQAREVRLAELTKALADKDKAVDDLKARVSKALLSFNSSDLQVKLKDGKVYVSLSEQLLFKSGSTKVDPKGQEALKKLATVLQEQKDVNVVVEGHTDNVPILRGTAGMTDNWDLSALRATEIARLLTTAGVSPERVTASGRSQYVPVAANDSPANKAMNRRTEIILTPKLNDLFQILDSNSSTPATAPATGK